MYDNYCKCLMERAALRCNFRESKELFNIHDECTDHSLKNKGKSVICEGAVFVCQLADVMRINPNPSYRGQKLPRFL